VRRLLTLRGWEVIETETAERALEVLGDPAARIDVVLCDLNLPGISGSALCAQIVQVRPELTSRVILTSGDPSAAALASEGWPVLAKPFSLVELEMLVGTALVS